ncbi:uncharacterized protein LOC122277069 [Carya illinoinensis]|uniref:uncharacterized protein LOC122277069 n=1 Tax=Carya illinoinensis TaxID=32201 RepID=UPI001C7248E4|nr:uncharacterized protein LOC122277069 [Carya illinoinensis]
MGVRDLRLFLLFALPLAFAGLFFGGVYSYNRPPVCKILSDHVPHSYGDDHNPVSPQQVHISLVGEDKMRISWITKISTPATIEYEKKKAPCIDGFLEISDNMLGRGGSEKLEGFSENGVDSLGSASSIFPVSETPCSIPHGQLHSRSPQLLCGRVWTEVLGPCPWLRHRPICLERHSPLLRPLLPRHSL